MDDQKNSVFWFDYDLTNERQFVKAVKHLQKMIRGSMTYNVWQKRSKIGVEFCPVCGESREYVKLESHHYPATLFDIVNDKVQMYIDFDTLDEKTDFDISQEIMDDHMMKKVEYIVLCEHCHKKYHDDHPEVIDAVEEAYQKLKKDKNEKESK